jgi:chromosome partitioning protein
MPTIVFASPKGGAGKSTAAVLLSTELAAKGGDVTIIDADPNRPVSRWAKRPNKPPSLNVIADVTEETIIPQIETAATRSAFVIVDLEGTASMTVGFALSRADLVIIPTKGSMLDAAEAVKAIKLLRAQEQAFRRKIPAVILFTQTNPAIRPRTLRHIEAQFQGSDVPVMKTHLFERDAYRAMFMFGGGVSTLDPGEVSNIKTAKANAESFMREVVACLKAQPSHLAEVA